MTLAKLRVWENDVQDIVQDTMMVVNEHFSEIETIEGLLAFTNEVMRNKIGNFYRARSRQQRRQVDWDDAPEPTLSIDEELEATELERVIWSAIDQLGEKRPRCRDIFLGLSHGLDANQLSRQLQIPRNRIDDRVYKCRRALRAILEQIYGLKL